MKNLFTLLFTLLVYTSFAQNAVVITEGLGTLAEKTNNSISVVIKGGDEKEVAKAWKKYLKDLKGKITDKKELFADDCKMEEMGDNTFDLYSKTEVIEGQGIKLTAAIDLGGAYLNSASHPAQFKVMRDFLYQFGVKENKAVIGLEIEEKQNTLKKLEKELANLEKKDGQMAEDITGLKSDIENYKIAKTDNLKNRQAKSDAVIALEKIDGNDETLETLKKEQKGLNKTGKKIDNDIESAKKKIAKTEEDKIENKKEREEKTKEITNQKAVIEEAINRQSSVK